MLLTHTRGLRAFEQLADDLAARRLANLFEQARNLRVDVAFQLQLVQYFVRPRAVPSLNFKSL